MDRTRSQDRDRRSGQDRRQEQERDQRTGQDRRALDRVRDQARIRQLADRWQASENKHPKWGHAFKKHVNITEQQLIKRAADWERANGHREDLPFDATKWRSADAMVVAADGLARSGEYQRRRADAEANGVARFTVTKPLPEVLGPGWRADVHGRTTASAGLQMSQWNDQSVVKATWQRRSDGQWHPVTCYPQPGE